MMTSWLRRWKTNTQLEMQGMILNFPTRGSLVAPVVDYMGYHIIGPIVHDYLVNLWLHGERLSCPHLPSVWWMGIGLVPRENSWLLSRLSDPGKSCLIQPVNECIVRVCMNQEAVVIMFNWSITTARWLPRAKKNNVKLVPALYQPAAAIKYALALLRVNSNNYVSRVHTVNTDTSSFS